PVTLAQMSDLLALLVEIHGQHEQQDLLTRQSQLALLDAYGLTTDELEAVGDAAAAWSALLEERRELLGRGDVSDRIDWLQHQFDDLEAEELEPESVARLLSDHRRQAHAGDLVAGCEAALASLSGGEIGRA